MMPKPTRDRREAQLYALMQTASGRDTILALYINTTGTMPLVGMLMSQMIEAILDREYPPAA